MIFLLSTVILLPLIVALSSIGAYVENKEQDGRGKTMGAIAGYMGVLYLIIACVSVINLDYQYGKDFESHWKLGVKASTIQLKQENVKNFYNTIMTRKHEFRDSSAVFMPTPNNSLDKNLEALKSLVDRFDKIQGMDENSLAYQTAMQQITGQEQDEASAMLIVFERCYDLNKTILFSWLGFLMVMLGLIFMSLGFTIAYGTN